MCSHLVPALRALLPVAFLCEVCVVTRFYLFFGNMVRARLVFIYMAWRNVAVGRKIRRWIDRLYIV